MNELLKDLQAGRFVPRWSYGDYGYKDTKGFDNALYRLRKKGHDIRMVKEAGDTMYYLKSVLYDLIRNGK